MRLAKHHLDIGLFTEEIEDQREFWGSTVGLRFDHELDFLPGLTQYRYDVHGSVVKVNQSAAALPDKRASGFSELAIARDGQSEDWTATHPGGDQVRLVVPGTDDIVGIGITISSPDPARLLDFYRHGLEFESLADDRLRCGDTVVRVVEGAGGQDLDEFAAPGFRYITVQVHDTDQEMSEIVRRGGRVAREPVDYAGVARYGFIADPDGNWIELSARTSLTGVKVG